MKGFRKAIFVALAILPMIALLAFVIANIGNAQGVEYLPLGNIAITDSADGVRFACTPDSWGERLIIPLTGAEPVDGLLGALGRLCLFFQEHAGIPVSVPVFMAILYGVYMFVVEMFDFLLGLLLFVPRKCSEVLK